jgi:hypothetical protein
MADSVIKPKADLLAAIRLERARLVEIVAGLSPERCTEPTLDGSRSIKDVLAHISAWEKICMAQVRNNQPLQAPPAGEPGPSTDVINQKVYEESRAKGVEEVMAGAQRSYDDLLALVESLSDDALLAVVGVGQEGAEGSPPVGQLISDNSDGHYREHIAQIERWLDRE